MVQQNFSEALLEQCDTQAKHKERQRRRLPPRSSAERPLQDSSFRRVFITEFATANSNSISTITCPDIRACTEALAPAQQAFTDPTPTRPNQPCKILSPHSHRQAFTRPSLQPRKLAIQCIYNAASFARFSHRATCTRRNLFKEKFLRPARHALQHFPATHIHTRSVLDVDSLARILLRCIYGLEIITARRTKDGANDTRVLSL